MFSLASQLSDRQSNLNYGFEARAINENGPSEWSETLFVESGAAELPNTPQALNVEGSALSSTSIGLSWVMLDDNRTTGVYQYVVQLQSTPVDIFSIVLTGLGNCTSGCNATVKSAAIRPATEYSILLAAQNSFATGLFSSPVSARTLGAAPEGVGSPQVLGVNTTSLACAHSADDTRSYASVQPRPRLRLSLTQCQLATAKFEW